MMSRIAAPSSEVTIPILRGSAGSARLRRRIEESFACEPLLQLIEGELQRAEALAARGARRRADIRPSGRRR